MNVFEDVVRDLDGVLVSGAKVYVYDSAGTLASLFESDKVTPKSNPLTSDTLGHVKAWIADDGYYTAEYYWGGRKRYIRANILLGASPIEQTQANAEEAAGILTAINLLAAGLVFDTPSDGVAVGTGVASGKFFCTWENSRLRVYLNNSGTAVLKLEIPTSAALLATLGASSGSSAIGFIQSGSGVVARTAQDKMRETVSAKDFGAVCNNSNDDTAAIQAAVNAVGSAGGGTVLIPGWSKITSTITVSYPNVRIVGTMRYASGLRATFNNGSLVKFYNATPYTGGAIESLSLRGPGSCVSGYAVEINNASAVTVTDIEIKNTWRGCGYLGTNTACRTVRVDTSDLNSDAFYIQGGNNQYFDNCTGYQNFVGGSLFRIVDTLGYWISNCVSQIHTYGILINPSTGQQVLNGFVQNCDLDLSTQDGLRIDTTGGGTVYNQEFVNVRRAFSSKKGTVITGSNTKSIRFVGGEAAKNVEEGVRISGGDDLWFIGSQVLGNSATGVGYWGLYATGGDNIHVLGGRYGPYPGASNNQEYGIALDSAFTGRFLAIGANLVGNTTAGMINSTTTASVRFEGCPGYVPPAASALTVGSSPYTYTAGAGRETLYIRAGTVSDVKVGSVTVFTATGCTVHLEPGQSCTITYSSAPTVARAFT